MTAAEQSNRYDYLLVGGGLQNGLMALAILARRPGARVALVERGERLGGNHTWCFHADDIAARARPFVDPLVTYRWPGYRVQFPSSSRVLDKPYAAVTSDQLDLVVSQALRQAPGSDLLLGCDVKDVAGERIILADGRQLHARAVIDARGPRTRFPAGTTGYQKFLGLELRLESPHGLERPVLMDATVPQTDDGYRFFYVLPFADDRLLVEETYFSDTPDLSVERLRTSVTDYAAARGFQVAEIVREETGVLPIPWQGEIPTPGDHGPLVAGYGGGWFHPGTGYSFPVAARLADHVSRTAPEDLFGPALHELAAEHRRQVRYIHKLNKMLFAWFPPDQRYHVMERFYRLPEETIRRFYALSLTHRDRLRIVMGRPPKGISWRLAIAGRKMALAERGAR